MYCIQLGAGLPTGSRAAVMAIASVAFWLWLSVPIGLGAAAMMALSWGSVAALHAAFGTTVLAVIGASVFVIAWVGQFIGHHIEGRRPSFFTDLVYLMIGPVWVLAKGYRKLSVGY